MGKIKLLTIAVITLLILNLGIIVFLISNRAERPWHHGEGPKMLIIEKLHFDKKQEAAYEKLIRWHRGTIDSLDKQIFDTKNLLYRELLNGNENKPEEDSLIQAIADYQKLIEQTHFIHFRDIKKICKPEQLPYYNALTKDLAQLFSKPPKRKHD